MKIGDIVYLKTDPQQAMRQITGIVIRPSGGLIISPAAQRKQYIMK
jgi:hypothetical protein